MFESVLVANRGEIALRVIRTLRLLDIRAIAVYSDADADAPHVIAADQAVRLGPAPPAESYLSISRLIDAARQTGAEAIHPGYGFVSENPEFARACAEAGIVFIGPSPEAIELLGNKVTAKGVAERASVPVLPGLQRPGLTDAEIIDFAREDPARLPLMLKASAGGGGRGMRIVRTLSELEPSLGAARREAFAGFGDDAVFVERYIERARHIEVQLLADAHGTVLYLGERECSLQRRHQKVMEESPSPAVDPDLRRRLGEASVRIAREAGYVGAGTAEFLVPADDPGAFAFLEVNARLQVEHPVTEAVTGLDLVELQLRVAAGEALAMRQEDVTLTGHAIEVRVCAEDPAAGFLPATGTLVSYREPDGPGIRVDSGVRRGSEIGGSYDSLVLKVIASGADREQSRERLARALSDTRLLGVTTNLGYLHRLLQDRAVRAAEMDTGLLERGSISATPEERQAREAAVAAAVIEALELRGSPASDPWESLAGFRLTGEVPIEVQLRPRGEEPISVQVGRASVDLGEHRFGLGARALDGSRIVVELDGHSHVWDHAVAGEERWVSASADAFAFTLVTPVVEGSASVSEGALEAPMPGSVLSVNVSEGDDVKAGEILVVCESMKMELTIQAPHDARVVSVNVRPGDTVAQGESLVELEAV